MSAGAAARLDWHRPDGVGTGPPPADGRQIVQGLVGCGYGDDDFAALLLLQAQSAGLELVSEHAEVPDGLDHGPASGRERRAGG